MPSPTIISGKDGKVTYGTGPTTLAITKWTRKVSGNTLKVPNTTDGMRRVAGLADVTGTIEVHVDTASTTEADLAVNTLVTIKQYTTSAKCYTDAAIIDSIDYSNEVEGSYDATINWSLATGAPQSAPA